jgi:hypothetical protein
VGPLAALGHACGLAYVDAVPLVAGASSCALVAARKTDGPRARLTGVQPGDSEEAVSRRTWEWGLAGLVAPAREERWEAERAALLADIADLEQQRDRALADRASALEQAAAADRRTVAVEQRLAKVESSLVMQVGRDLISVRRHPLKGTRALVRDALHARRQRSGR